MNLNLSSLNQLPPHVDVPRYDPKNHKIGIVHFGLGAFHKAHQAFYTDRAIEASGGNWRICGVSLRSTEVPKQLTAQHGLYSLLTRSNDGGNARVIASIEKALSAREQSEELLALLSMAEIRIVSLTITEKGYGIDRQTGGIDRANSAISDDLKNLSSPQSAIGFIVAALQERRRIGRPGFAVLCCDNLPDNGVFVKGGVLDFAQRVDPSLAEWIKENVSFPSSMVDRITPAQSSETLEYSEKLTGRTDLAAIEAEPFHQWVIEDNFPMGRPDWGAAGVIFTDDLAPFEMMKLRMLNGSHSLLAYGGFLSGHNYVRDVMGDAEIASLIKRHMFAAAKTLAPVPGIDLNDYADSLCKRFENPFIAHETKQIAMDGSQKLPQRIFAPAVVALEKGHDVSSFVLATALWIRYCSGRDEKGNRYEVDDPISQELLRIAGSGMSAEDIVGQFNTLPGVVPPELCANEQWNQELVLCLDDLYKSGVRQVLEKQLS